MMRILLGGGGGGADGERALGNGRVKRERPSSFCQWIV